MAQSGSNKKVANSLVAASAAAVLAVYAAGYERTQSAAEKLDAQFAERRSPGAEARMDRAPMREPVSAAEPAGFVPAGAASDERSAPAQIASLESGPAIQQERSTTAAQMAPAPVAETEQKPEAAIAPAVVPATSGAIAPAPLVPTPVQAPPAPVVSILAPPAAPALAVPPAVAAPAAKWKDGTYTGWGTCRHGDIQAAVVIENGRIVSARVAQCMTRYSCNVIDRIIPQVALRQSADVDWVSGATQSSDAFYYAVSEALKSAK